MVKKKAPFIPLTIIALLLAVAVAVNLNLHPKDPDEMKKEAAQQAAEAHKNTPPPATTSAELNSSIKSSLSGASPSGPGQPATGMPMKAMGKPGMGDVMVQRKPAQFKPKPNPTSTDSEWYKVR